MSTPTLSKKTLKPLGNRVLVKRLEQADTLKGGIILPDSAKKKQEMAEVIAVGPGSFSKEGTRLPMPVAIGQKILMDQYGGQEVTVDNEEFIVLRADDIIAIIEQ